MTITLEIPDEMAERLQRSEGAAAVGASLPRRALEAFAAEEYRHGRLNKPDLRRLLGFETSDQIDTFLKAHEVWIDFTMDELEKEQAGLRRLGY